MKCKNCKFCSDTKCYGHGEFWATCKLLEMLYDQLKGRKTMSITDTICYEEDQCHIIENINDAKKLRDKKYMEYFNEKSEIIYKALKAYEIPKEEWNKQYKEKIKNRTIEDYKRILNIDK